MARGDDQQELGVVINFDAKEEAAIQKATKIISRVTSEVTKAQKAYSKLGAEGEKATSRLTKSFTSLQSKGSKSITSLVNKSISELKRMERYGGYAVDRFQKHIDKSFARAHKQGMVSMGRLEKETKLSFDRMSRQAAKTSTRISRSLAISVQPMRQAIKEMERLYSRFAQKISSTRVMPNIGAPSAVGGGGGGGVVSSSGGAGAMGGGRGRGGGFGLEVGWAMQFAAYGFVSSLMNTLNTGFSMLYDGARRAAGALQELSKSFVAINELFMGMETTLVSVFGSDQIAKKVTDEIASITAKSFIPMEDLIQLYRSASVLPSFRGGFAKQAQENTLNDPSGMFAQFRTLVEQMLTFRPDKTAKDAIFSIREALAGQFRSLARRFDVSIALIERMTGMSKKELKGAPEEALKGLQEFFSSIITPEATQKIARFPTKLIENILEQFKVIGQRMVGDVKGGILDNVVNKLSYILDVVATPFFRPNGPFAEIFAKPLNNILVKGFENTIDSLGKAVESLLKYFGYGKDKGGTLIERGMGFFQKTLSYVADTLPKFIDEVVALLPSFIDFVKGLIKLGASLMKAFAWLFNVNPMAGVAAYSLFQTLPIIIASSIGTAIRSAVGAGMFGRGGAASAAAASGAASGAAASAAKAPSSRFSSFSQKWGATPLIFPSGQRRVVRDAKTGKIIANVGGSKTWLNSLGSSFSKKSSTSAIATSGGIFTAASTSVRTFGAFIGKATLATAAITLAMEGLYLIVRKVADWYKSRQKEIAEKYNNPLISTEKARNARFEQMKNFSKDNPAFKMPMGATSGWGDIVGPSGETIRAKLFEEGIPILKSMDAVIEEYGELSSSISEMEQRGDYGKALIKARVRLTEISKYFDALESTAGRLVDTSAFKRMSQADTDKLNEIFGVKYRGFGNRFVKFLDETKKAGETADQVRPQIDSISGAVRSITNMLQDMNKVELSSEAQNMLKAVKEITAPTENTNKVKEAALMSVRESMSQFSDIAKYMTDPDNLTKEFSKMRNEQVAASQAFETLVKQGGYTDDKIWTNYEGQDVSVSQVREFVKKAETQADIVRNYALMLSGARASIEAMGQQALERVDAEVSKDVSKLIKNIETNTGASMRTAINIAESLANMSEGILNADQIISEAKSVLESKDDKLIDDFIEKVYSAATDPIAKEIEGSIENLDKIRINIESILGDYLRNVAANVNSGIANAIQSFGMSLGGAPSDSPQSIGATKPLERTDLGVMVDTIRQDSGIDRANKGGGKGASLVKSAKRILDDLFAAIESNSGEYYSSRLANLLQKNFADAFASIRTDSLGKDISDQMVSRWQEMVFSGNSLTSQLKAQAEIYETLRDNALEAAESHKALSKEWNEATQAALTFNQKAVQVRQRLDDLVGIKPMLQDMWSSFKSSMSENISAFITKTKTASEAFSDFANSFIEQAVQMITNWAVNQLFGNLMGGGATSSMGGGMGVFGMLFGGMFAKGGLVTSGSGTKDDVPALLTRGEYVLPKGIVSQIGVSRLDKIVHGHDMPPSQIMQFQDGGYVPTFPSRGASSQTGGVNVNNTVHVTIAGSSGDTTKDQAYADMVAKKVLEHIDVRVDERIKRADRLGGILRQRNYA